MGYTQDWLIRQIEGIGRCVAKLIFKTSSIEYEIHDKDNYSQADKLYEEIHNLIRQHKICEAENLLFKTLDESNLDYLKVAVDFYQTISKFSENQLEECNFSREEIFEGLQDILKIYNVPISNFDLI
ncbi:hypothetical protein SDC9_75480 [bioreactor metagenome]|uniref:Uncharacterized protein n=1 Tax=bioreactor metagenome TaxID=1076179 RepID=A0A644YJW9_9ZZZZ|nr:DUF6483 family protein [Romboutsia lituseburensis]